MLEAGTVVGPYRVEAHVATGGMGEVYRVVHQERGTSHALKYLPLMSSRIRKRLLREAEVMMRLSHPNVVNLTEVLDIDGDPGILMEFIDGPSLSRWLRTHRLSVDQAEHLFRGILSGVGHAHRKGLVHRDLKPSNILLARTADGLVPKVADFGIAKESDPGGKEKLTRTGHSLGSPAYMAPEQIQDAHEVDARADLFSLGCLFYEMVCGERAFKGKDTLEVLNAVTQGHYVPPEQVVPDLPARIGEVIARCLVQDRARRIESCEAVVALLDGEGESTPRPDARRPLAGSEERTAPRIPPAIANERTAPRVRVPTVAGLLLAAVVLVGALLVGVLGAWLILG